VKKKAKTYAYDPDYVVHPGETLQEWLEYNNLPHEPARRQPPPRTRVSTAVTSVSNADTTWAVTASNVCGLRRHVKRCGGKRKR
jgi:hypothetical protein